MSYSHRQLLKTMFEFELRNNLDIKVNRHLSGENKLDPKELSNIVIAREYIQKRIEELK